MIRIYIIGVIAFLATSCSGFLKEYSQDLAYVHSYADLDELLIGGAYLNSDFNDLYGGYTPYIHLMGDEIEENIEDNYGQEYSSTIRDDYFGYYTWQKRIDLGFDKQVKIADEGTDWKHIYEHINVANMIIQGISEQSAKDELEKKEIDRIKGEAYFLRGAYYFWLVNLYGKPYTPTMAANDPGVPLKTTEYVEDKKFTRSSVQEIYDQVLKDLDEAEKNLENVAHKSIYRADITTTYLLKSRVYLYMRNWEKAKYYAEKVLEKNDRLVDLNNFDASSGKYFLTSGSVEVIFSTGNNQIALEFTSVRQKGMSASRDLIDQYEKNGNDLRLNIFLNTDYPPYYPCNKYGGYGSADISDMCVYRTAEAYLNLAEACAYLNDEEGARKALNTLRKCRFQVGTKDIDLSGKELVEEIRDERYRELAFEGHRWYDLRRYTVCDRYPLEKVLRNTYSTYLEDGWTVKLLQTFVYELKPGDPAYVLPIPKDVLEFDELIKDNPRDERGVAETINYN